MADAGRAYACAGADDTGDGALKLFVAQMKFLREKAKLTQADFGKAIGYSEELVRSVECGRRFPRPEFIGAAERVLDAGGMLTVAQQHLSRPQVRYPHWFRDFARLEAEAINLYAYECRVVPGLLQTADYARAVFESRLPPLEDEQIEQLVTDRVARQSLLTRKPPVALSFIIEQSVLERRTGGAEVMRQQVDHLLKCPELRNVTLQVMPLCQEIHAGLAGPMRLVETSEHQWLGYFEGQRGSLLISEAKEVSVLLQRYSTLRTQALTPEDSVILMKRLRGEL